MDDDDLFANRLSNRYVVSNFDEPEEGEKAGEAEVMIELSPVAVQLFYQNRASLYVPLHFFYCLALQEVGFRVLKDNGYLMVFYPYVGY